MNTFILSDDLRKFTCLNDCLVNKRFPNPRTITGFCVPIITVIIIRCNSIGYEYQSLWQMESSISSNRPVTRSAFSQKKNIVANDQNIKNSGRIISIGLPWDWMDSWKWQTKMLFHQNPVATDIKPMILNHFHFNH